MPLVGNLFLYYKYNKTMEKNMFESQRYYKIENNNITHFTLEEEVSFVYSKIQDKDMGDLYLYYYKQYIQPNAKIWCVPDGLIEFNNWYEETYDDYETEALVKIVHGILSKTAGDISYKRAQEKLKVIQANKDFE